MNLFDSRAILPATNVAKRRQVDFGGYLAYFRPHLHAQWFAPARGDESGVSYLAAAADAIRSTIVFIPVRAAVISPIRSKLFTMLLGLLSTAPVLPTPSPCF